MSTVEVATAPGPPTPATRRPHARSRPRSGSWTTTLLVAVASLASSGLWLGILALRLPTGTSLRRAVMAWDGGWYLRVARIGYTDSATGRRSTAFPPLLPLIERGWMSISHVSVVGFVVALSMVAQAAAACVLWSLLGRPATTGAARVRYLILFLVSPPVVFDIMGYASSLFVLTAFLGLWFLQRDRTWAAAVTLGLGCGLNLGGLALVAAFAVSTVLTVLRHREAVARRLGRVALQLAAALAVPVAYAVYLQAHLGSWRIFYTALQEWERPLPLRQVVVRTVTFAPVRKSVRVFLHHPHGAWPSYAMDSVTVILMLALLVGLLVGRGWASYHFWSLFFVVLLAQDQAARYGAEYSFTRLVLPIGLAAGTYPPVRRVLARPWVFTVLAVVFTAGTLVYLQRLATLQWVD